MCEHTVVIQNEQTSQEDDYRGEGKLRAVIQA